MVGFFKYLKSTGRSSDYAFKIKESIKKTESFNTRMGKIQSFLVAVREPLVLFVVLSVIYIQVIIFQESLGILLLSLMFLYRAINYVMAVQTNWNGYLSFSGSLNNVQNFLKELEANKQIYGSKVFKSFKDKIEIKDVNFNYNSSREVLKGINLIIDKNKTVAFVGASGSGKTTLVNLVTGLLQPTSGELYIDGNDLLDIDIRTLQNKIGYITQEPVMFDDSIFNNVTFWAEKNKVNIDKFWSAVNQAAIEGFVRSLPLKEDEQMGSNGVMVSGGQKQRVSIARELYKEIDILVMDEATASLDSNTELEIQQNIENLRGHYTMLIVAHRLSTIKNADLIVIMNNGVISDKGSFSDLYHKNESFKQMVDMQEL